MSQLKVNSIVPTGGVASGQGGGIIQTTTVTKTTQFSHSTATFTDITGLTVDITPVAGNSKINIIINVTCGGPSNSFPAFRLRRNGTTNISLGTSQGSNQTQVSFGCRLVNETEMDSLGYTFVDSPSYSVGDTLTYNLQIASKHNNAAVRVNRAGPTANQPYAFFGTSTITCQEVGT